MHFPERTRSARASCTCCSLCRPPPPEPSDVGVCLSYRHGSIWEGFPPPAPPCRSLYLTLKQLGWFAPQGAGGGTLQPASCPKSAKPRSLARSLGMNKFSCSWKIPRTQSWFHWQHFCNRHWVRFTRPTPRRVRLPMEESAIIIPILQVRKLRHKGVKT